MASPVRRLATLLSLALIASSCGQCGSTGATSDAGVIPDGSVGPDGGLDDGGPLPDSGTIGDAGDAGEDEDGGVVDDGGDAGPFGQMSTPVTPAQIGSGGGVGNGIANVPDGGGVVLSHAANFKSNFAYVANSGQAIGNSFVARVDTVSGAELARYPSVVPIDNQGSLLCSPGDPTSCLVDVTSTYYSNAPSRTVVDLNGGVFVANRGQCDWLTCTPGNGKFLGTIGTRQYVQGSVTYVANFVDHPEQCAPRCVARLGWALPDGGSAPFTAGTSLPLPDGGAVTIPAGEVLMASAGMAVAPDVWAHPCLLDDGGTHDPSDVTDPTNFDDCARFTIPIGAPNGYDIGDGGYTDRFAPRGLAISKTCGGFEGPGQACDVYVGLTEPATENAQIVHLDHHTNFGVKGTIDSHLTDYGLYGAAIDCEGILWADNNLGDRIGIDTATDQPVTAWTYLDSNQQTQTSYTVTESSGACLGYGIATDLNRRVWTGLVKRSGGSESGACAFDFLGFQAQAALFDGGLSQSAAQTLIQSDWKVFSFRNVFPQGYARGIVADEFGDIFLSVSDNGWSGNLPGLVAFDYDGTGSGCGAVDGGADSPCLWSFHGQSGIPYGGGTIGVDLDQDGNPWIAQSGGSPPGVMGLSSATGLPLPPFTDGGLSLAGPGSVDDIYSYSDFTGYALRKITQPAGNYQQIFTGCSLSDSTWQSLDYAALLPFGTDLRIEVDVADDLSAFSGGGGQILDSWTCDSAANCPSVASFRADGGGLIGQYARVTVTLQAPSCTVGGQSPTLESLKLNYYCPPYMPH